MLINRQTIKCDVKDCNEEFSIKENIAWGAKPNFIELPAGWINIIGYKTYYGNFYICPKHDVDLMIDLEILI